MSQTPAAALHIGLLAAKGTAQPSRGLTQPVVGGDATEGARLRSLGAGKIARMNPTAPRRIGILLDERQRLRLRLASAHLGKSRQEIVIDAVEHYLTEVVPTFLHGPCSCIGGTQSETDPCCQDKP